MAISDQIGRLTTLRNNIRTKLIGLGILPAASTSATLSECYSVLSNVTGLGASSYTPTTTTQVIPSGRYLSGPQTINAIPSSYIIPTGTSVITSNNTYDIKQYASVSVNVQPALQSKTVTPTQAVQSVTPDAGIYGLSKVTVNAIPSSYIIPTGTITLSESGTFDVTSYASADVTVTGGPSEPYLVFTNSSSASLYLNGSNVIPSAALCFRDNIRLALYDPNDVLSVGDKVFRGTGFESNYDLPSLPNLKIVGNRGFCGYELNGFVWSSNPVLEKVGEHAFGLGVIRFRNIKNINVTFGNLSSIGIGGFANLFNESGHSSFYAYDIARYTVSTNTGSFTGGALGTINGEIRMPLLSEIPTYCFAFGARLNSYNLSRLSQKYYFDSAMDIGAGAFLGNEAITEFHASVLSRIYSSCFAYCTKLSVLDCPNVREIGHAAFKMYETTEILYSVNIYGIPISQAITSSLSKLITNLKSIPSSFFPNVNILSAYAFKHQRNLKTVSFPNVSILSGAEIFAGCVNLESIYLPAFSYTVSNLACFQSCTKLSTVSFPATSKISGNSMFRSCYNLISLFFLGSSVCALGNTIASMFYSTPVSTYSTSAGRWASIFVPQSLLASYKAATNWTTISSKIFAYESYFDANGNPL